MQSQYLLSQPTLRREGDEEVEGVGVRGAVFGGEFFDQFDGVVEATGRAEGPDGDVGGGSVGGDPGGQH